VKENFLAALETQSASQGLSRALGLEVENITPGQARVSMLCRSDMINVLGMIHGTAIFALMDEAFQLAANSHGSIAVALNLSITFHQGPVVGERLTAVAKESHAGRRTATYYIEVSKADGSLVASGQALAYRKGQAIQF
jgi:acyl-CoA thioesterase